MHRAKYGVSPREIPAVAPPQLNAHVEPEYAVVVNPDRRYTKVSDSFCKLVGYTREELLEMKFDELTARRTNDIPIVMELFLRSRYMHGIWILVHRTGTKILVRYEAWVRPDGQYQCNMELLGAGA